MNHDAVYALYPNVVTIEDTKGATDKDGSPVIVDQTLVDAWVNPSAYKEARALAYAPLSEQLDMQYWDAMNGTVTWLDHIRSVKEAHPKGTK